MDPSIEIVRTTRGARVLQRGLILSEVLATPGASDSLFDILAACLSVSGRGQRIGILGFAAGGVVAPLRALGHAHPLIGVDLDTSLVPLFRELSDPWCGEVRVTRADAAAWLKRGTTPFDVLLEDLSVRLGREVTKPEVSWTRLPRLMRRRLAPGGVCVTNVLPVPGRPWVRVLGDMASPFREARVIHLEAWENRVLLCGSVLPDAATLGRQLRARLAAIGSVEAEQLSVRRFIARRRSRPR